MTTRYAFTALFSLSSLFTFAEHLPGGTISTRCVGANFHEVTLKLFRDCSGSPMIAQALNFSNDCGVLFSQSNLQPVSVEEISPLCVEDLPNSTCNGGTLVGFELYTYRMTVFLSPCNSWHINWSICCRNESINVGGTPGLFLETSLNNAGGACNASPEFVNNTVPLVCVGQPVSYDASAMESEGQTLRYRFINARFAAPVPTQVNYNPPYNGLEPFTGMVLDSLTGRITFLPTIVGIIVTVVEVNEYGANGNWISSVMRDFPFFVSACANAVPSIESGTFADATGSAEISGARALRVCSAGAFCASLSFADDDVDQELTITSNAGSVLAGATLERTGTNPVSAQLCWDPTGVAPGSYQFTITATDNACPIQAFQQFDYTITIGTPANAGLDSAVTYCAAEEPFDLIDMLNGSPALNGVWTNSLGDPVAAQFDPSSDQPGAFTYTVTSATSCVATATLTLTLLEPSDPLCMTVGLADHAAPTLRVTSDATLPGLFRLSTTGGNYDLTVISSDGRMVSSGRMAITSQVLMLLDLSDLSSGAYVLRLINGRNGAMMTERVIVP